MRVWRYVRKQSNGWWRAGCWTRGLAHYADVVRRTKREALAAIRPLAKAMMEVRGGG